LRTRVIGRGLGSALLVAASWPPANASASLPSALIARTIQAARLLAAGQTVPGIISAKVHALTQGVSTAMFWTKLTIAPALLLGVLGAGAGLHNQQTRAEAHDAATQRTPNGNRDVAAAHDKTHVDRARQADGKGRILFAYSPSAIADPRGVASIRMTDKKET